MTLVLVLEQRFDRTSDGRVWAPGPFLSAVWPRYLQVFSRLRVVARVRNVPTAARDWERADGEAVSFAAVPHYLGPWQYLLKYAQVKAAVGAAVGPRDAVILRVSSTIASTLEPILTRRQHPFALEVVSDPYDVFAPGSIVHPLRPFLRWQSPRRLRRMCRRAIAALYVTEQALQRRYPCLAYSETAADVELTEDAVSCCPRTIDPAKRTFTLVTVGTLAQLYKGTDVLIDSVARCVRAHCDVRLIIVGDGKYRPALEARARHLNVADRVLFRGHLVSRAAVRAVLDESDLFILPSRTEGLPRALVEAMARALPCVGSIVGGIPELLSPEDLVPPGDAPALARKIHDVLSDPQRLVRMSARNLERAGNFREEELQRRRVTFYAHVRDKTAAWTRLMGQDLCERGGAGP